MTWINTLNPSEITEGDKPYGDYWAEAPARPGPLHTPIFDKGVFAEWVAPPDAAETTKRIARAAIAATEITTDDLRQAILRVWALVDPVSAPRDPLYVKLASVDAKADAAAVAQAEPI